jgi:LmbE family N-acetylglucosaminyl deacetylase
MPLTIGRVRALVISPHPDDATLGAGGLIQRAIGEGGTVQVVQMTGGDGFPRGVTTINPRMSPTPVAYRWYGSVREREAIRAMRQLGIHRAQLRLLGFPDEGLCALASTYRTGPAFESPYTKRESPPDAEQVVHGTMYRGDDVIRELARLIEDFRPTLVVVPGSADEHPDHCATHLLVHQALTDAVDAGVRPPRVLHYVIHYPQWLSGDVAAAGREPPADHAINAWQWRTLVLKPFEQTAKQQALDAFRSQMLVMPDFLKSFARANELFIEDEPPLPIPCWCSGANIAGATRVVH